MDVEQCVLCQTETKESLSSVKSGLANLIPYAKDFKNTALENHLVAIKIEKEKKNRQSTGGQNPSIVSRCQTTYINDHQVKKLVHHQPKIRKPQLDLHLIILIGKQTACFVVKHVLPMRRILKEEKMSTVQGKERRKERDDEEARVIEHCVRSCFDFIAAETRFYNICRNVFYLKVKTKTITSPAPSTR